ncbi:PREDICTED: uncharacterized protein LOC105451621 [Wasmannia auropunctata]|uniref:uncharacterized protein LOC105451621 n=1 Tax=Wasmannia auropunctata TaxID=64793 RepID=UPI0005EE0378|nr:PREDICTED: uncharacterized protein LOC105451621 [Wasmannia auropunctata]
MFAVVTFDDASTSEVPTNWLIDEEDGSSCWWPPSNTKNLSTLISKRVDPIKSTWQKLNVIMERTCDTLEKARKVAEDSQYTSVDEENLGRGRRKRFSKKLYIYDTDEDSRSDQTISQQRSNKKKLENKLPTFPKDFQLSADESSDSAISKINIPVPKKISQQLNKKKSKNKVSNFPEDFQLTESNNNAVSKVNISIPNII